VDLSNLQNKLSHQEDSEERIDGYTPIQEDDRIDGYTPISDEKENDKDRTKVKKERQLNNKRRDRYSS
jgi:hypothetical protein